MNLFSFCIKRPVFATVLSLLLVVIGIMGYHNLRTRFFPKFEPAKVFVMTSYPGASAKLVENTITTPLEKSLSGLEGVDDITSTSSQGSSTIDVTLLPGVDIYNTTNRIRNQIAMAAASLPTTIHAPLVQMGHGDIVLMDIGFSVEGNQLKPLRDYLDRYVINRLQQLPGISTVDVLGANKSVMRITLHPNQMTARQVTIEDIQQAINNSNLQLPAGFIKTPDMSFPITAKTALNSVAQFSDVVVKTINGQSIYLKDVATVTLGSDIATQSIIHINGQRAILLTIYNSEDANPITASANVRQLLDSIKKQLPSDIKCTITFDQATYMRASIAEVYKTIGIAILFVAMIIFLSLGKLRSALIPIVTIPICLLATVGFMYFLGFSLNIITLLAIVLSIGLVVDDAIVVLENTHRHMEKGLSRVEASLAAVQEIATPIIAMTLTLAAVYAPIGLMQGQVAHLFAPFAITLAVAVIISGFVALTLSPMMCSKLLQQESQTKSEFNLQIDHCFQKLTRGYVTGLHVLLSHRLKIIVITLLLVIGGFFIAKTLPKTFLPKEDMGFVVTLLKSEMGSNNDASADQLTMLNQLLSEQKSIQTNVSLSFSQEGQAENNNMIFSTLKSYDKRHQSANQIADAVNKIFKETAGLNAISFAPAFGGSTNSEIEFYITAPSSYHYLYQVGDTLTKQLTDYPGLKNVSSNVQFNNQEYDLTVNRSLADQLHVPISNIDNTIAAMLGGSTVSTYDDNGQTVDVEMQAETPYLQSIDAIKRLTVQNTSQQFISLDNLITITPTLAQSNLLHYDNLRAALISAELAPGYSMGTVVAYLQNALPTLLPSQVKYAFSGQAKRIVDSSNSMSIIFLLAIVFIYLVLSAQFESFLDPFIILLAVPLSVIGALFSLKLVGGSINLYTVIGLVTLVGLIAKHGILITQFANKLHEAGKTAKEALIEAASIRLRPILMTTAAMVFGALPLVFAVGASAVSREQVGTVIVGGLLFGTFFSLVLVPISYSYFAQLKEFVKRKQGQLR